MESQEQPDPDDGEQSDRPDSIEQFVTDLRLLKERSGLTFKQMATRAQLSNSTLHAAVAPGNVQLPSAATVQAFVRTTVDPSSRDVEVHRWLDRRAKLATRSTDGGAGFDGVRQPPDAQPEGRNRPRALKRRIVQLVILLLVAIGVFWAGRLTADVGSRQQTGGATSRSLPIVEAIVANTNGMGVFTYQLPTNTSRKMSSLQDGDPVNVICLRLDGKAIKDDALRMTRTVWALLDSGFWVPDLYLSLDKSWSPPSRPPAPLLAC